MEKKNIEELNDAELNQIINNPFYNIQIHGGIVKGDSENIGKTTIDLKLWVDKWSQELINNILRILQNEVDIVKILTIYEDYYPCLQYFLLARFKEEFKNNKNLVEEVEKKIKNLEENKFLTSKTDYEKREVVFEDISLESFKQMFLSLRKRRIAVYNSLLNDYKKNPEKYRDFLEKRL